MKIREETTARSGLGRPWAQLAIGVLAMTMIANLQYGWTLFVNPIQHAHGWDRASIQIAFTLFIVAETWLVPGAGYLVDRFGPRRLVALAALLVGASWALDSVATSLAQLYLAQAIGGVGAGAVYGACVGNALKWFPGRRGLAAGVTAAGFGMGSALTIVPISLVIARFGYPAAFLTFGLLQGFVVLLCAGLLRAPAHLAGAEQGGAYQTAAATARHYAPFEMTKTPVFWLLYAMFVMMASGGLMATAQLGPIAKDFGIAETPVTLVGLTLPALTFALSLDRVLNGLTRPFFGWVSDHIGRELTMGIAFGLEGLATLALSQFGHSPVLFVILTGIVFFAWGEIYSLFPATCVDTFGPRYASANTGLLYTAKGAAALLVPFSSLLVSANGDWRVVFYIAAALNLITAALALTVLGPMRRAQAARDAGVAARAADTARPSLRSVGSSAN